MIRYISVLAICAIVFATFIYGGSARLSDDSVGERRARVLGELSRAIDDAVSAGKYGCCIDPPCTMCYMGSWIWDDGTCRCDEMIANGEFDKVCPQCMRGIEEGQCKSSSAASCDIEDD